MSRRVITEDAYLDRLGRSVDDELGTIETLDKNAVSETTSECPSERMQELEQDRQCRWERRVIM